MKKQIEHNLKAERRDLKNLAHAGARPKPQAPKQARRPKPLSPRNDNPQDIIYVRSDIRNNINLFMEKKLIVIVGPTASGKSSLGINLARKFKGEIISADSRQVYKGMDIGTGKVTKAEQRTN